MNKKQYADSKMRGMFGLHPFEELCDECVLPDCQYNNKQCLQKKVLGKEPQNALSWEKMTHAMIDAGLTDNRKLRDIAAMFGIKVADEPIERMRKEG